MTFELNQVTTIFLSVALLTLGMILVKKVRVLQKFCIPAPVVGGLLFALFATITKSLGWLEITLDTSLQSLFMLTFFTTIGLGCNVRCCHCPEYR
jgi:ESS family glutamate:Na+ symporter